MDALSPFPFLLIKLGAEIWTKKKRMRRCAEQKRHPKLGKKGYP
jgi:hypothetical protein